MEGSGYFMLSGGYKQSGEGGKEPSVIQAMKQKLEKMKDVEKCWEVLTKVKVCGVDVNQDLEIWLTE